MNLAEICKTMYPHKPGMLPNIFNDRFRYKVSAVMETILRTPNQKGWNVTKGFTLYILLLHKNSIILFLVFEIADSGTQFHTAQRQHRPSYRYQTTNIVPPNRLRSRVCHILRFPSIWGTFTKKFRLWLAPLLYESDFLGTTKNLGA